MGLLQSGLYRGRGRLLPELYTPDDQAGGPDDAFEVALLDATTVSRCDN